MALYSPMTYTPLSEQYGSATAGQAVTAITPNAGGDSIALVGSYVFLRFQTTGTGSTITLDSVELSNFGSDVNVTVTMGATAIQKIAIKTDPRFKQTAGNVGYLNLTYTAVTGMTIEAESLS
jgi:hypothetical protein